MSVTRQHDAGGPPILENEGPPGIHDLVLGYQQTKWVAERLVARAAECGVPVTIFRPGAVGPHSQTGAYNVSDVFVRVLCAADRDGVIPEFPAVNAVPVDWLARLRLAGWNVRVRAVPEWLAMAREAASVEDHPLAPIASLVNAPLHWNYVAQVITGPSVDTTSTARALAGRNLDCPALDAQLLRTWFDRLRADGLVAPLGTRPDGGRRRYLWFDERFRGFGVTEGAERLRCGPAMERGRDARTRLDLDLVAWIHSLQELTEHRTVQVEGTVFAEALSATPLHILEGTWTLRPDSVASAASDEVALLRYELALVSDEGEAFRLEGVKWGHASPDLWTQSRSLDVRIYDAARTLRLVGRTVVPADTYVEDQVRGLRFDDGLSVDEQRRAKAAWFAFLGLELGRSWFGLAQRVAASFFGGGS